MDTLVRIENVSKVYPRVHKPRERLQAFISLLFGKEPSHGAKVLSGMDNVRMKAFLMGLSAQELDERLDEILAFADIGEYIHEPVKHYSSGMVVRLGFAVLTACKPDLLITDEVLAVGDESFQKKCMRWIKQYLEQGGTLLLVSHSMYVVQKLCQKSLWIHDGRIEQYGDALPITQAYLAWHEERSAKEADERMRAAGDGGFYHIEKFALVPEPTNANPKFAIHETLTIELQIYSPDDRPPVGVVGIVGTNGTPVYGVISDDENITPVKIADHNYRFRIRFTNLNLLPGSYTLTGHSMDPEGLRMFDRSKISFTITGETKEVGFIRLSHEWS